ncbi:hypothetical protein KM043_004510 [Ampulex compressa]|nr:hypothetical protein KM043_004510 [Ampulex compressa]
MAAKLEDRACPGTINHPSIPISNLIRPVFRALSSEACKQNAQSTAITSVGRDRNCRREPFIVALDHRPAYGMIHRVVASVTSQHPWKCIPLAMPG